MARSDESVNLMLAGLRSRVDAPASVGVVDCLGDLADQRRGLGGGHGSARDALGERRALDQFHDNRAIFDLADYGDMRVVEFGEQAGLALKGSEEIRVACVDQ